MTLKEKFNAWEVYPLFTPKYVIQCFGCYTAFFIALGSLFLAQISSLSEISIDYIPSAACTDSSSTLTIDGNAKLISRSCSDKNSGVGSSTTSTTAVEEIEIELTADFGTSSDEQILIYWEIEGFHQNHIRYIKSNQNFDAFRQIRTGDCMGYQAKRTGCKAEDWNLLSGNNEYPIPPSPQSDCLLYQDAIYRLWHPKTMGSPGRGCWLWWSTQSDECMKTGGSGGVCDKGPLDTTTPNKVYYPCGLGARAWTNTGRDTFAIKDVEFLMKPEDITFKNDYMNQFRNLNPDGIFDKSKNSDSDNNADHLHQKSFKEILEFHTLKMHPPTVCEDDPLNLIEPDQIANGQVDCTKYHGWDFDSKLNTASCTYTIGGSNKVDPVSGNAITCGTKKPNPAGWGIENSHYMNWVRIAGLPTFRKLYAKVVGNWKSGEKKKILIANRMNMKVIDGPSTSSKKRLVITTAGSFGTKNTWMGIFFLVVAFITGSLTVAIYFRHNKDPRPLEKVIYMGWS